MAQTVIEHMARYGALLPDRVLKMRTEGQMAHEHFTHCMSDHMQNIKETNDFHTRLLNDMQNETRMAFTSLAEQREQCQNMMDQCAQQVAWGHDIVGKMGQGHREIASRMGG